MVVDLWIDVQSTNTPLDSEPIAFRQQHWESQGCNILYLDELINLIFRHEADKKQGVPYFNFVNFFLDNQSIHRLICILTNSGRP